MLDSENVTHLKQNGRLYFLDRDLKNLIFTSDRPLASSREALEKRYKERYPIYRACCDFTVDGNKGVSEVAEDIINKHNERK